MLPAEKHERLVRRVGVIVLVLMAGYIIIWLVRFIGGIAHQALEQRSVPIEEGAAKALEIG